MQRHFSGGYLSQRLLSKGYSVGASRKIVESICMGTELTCLMLIGNNAYKFKLAFSDYFCINCDDIRFK
jgi:hypothetical protein